MQYRLFTGDCREVLKTFQTIQLMAVLRIPRMAWGWRAGTILSPLKRFGKKFCAFLSQGLFA